MEAITLETEDGLKLEGEVHVLDQPPLGSAVICHPHPQYGGSKDHPLLWAIRIDLVRRLKAQAAHHRRSLNLEVITCLEAATGPTQVDPEALLATARAIRITPKGLRVTDRLLKEMKNEGRP